MREKAGLPILALPSAAAWESWPAEHHASSDGLGLELAGRSAGLDSLISAEAQGRMRPWEVDRAKADGRPARC